MAFTALMLDDPGLCSGCLFSGVFARTFDSGPAPATTYQEALVFQNERRSASKLFHLLLLLGFHLPLARVCGSNFIPWNITVTAALGQLKNLHSESPGACHHLAFGGKEWEEKSHVFSHSLGPFLPHHSPICVDRRKLVRPPFSLLYSRNESVRCCQVKVQRMLTSERSRTQLHKRRNE